jgi:hypothetical protein
LVEDGEVCLAAFQSLLQLDDLQGEEFLLLVVFFVGFQEFEVLLGR